MYVCGLFFLCNIYFATSSSTRNIQDAEINKIITKKKTNNARKGNWNEDLSQVR